MSLKKSLCLALSLVLSAPTTFAATDRTQGVTTEAVSEAKLELADLKSNLVKLDRILQSSEAELNQALNSKNRTAHKYIAGFTAALGAAVGAFGAFYSRIAQENILSGISTGGTILFGGIVEIVTISDFTFNGNISTTKAEESLKKIKAQVAEEKSKAKGSNAAMLNKLDESLVDVASALQDFKASQNLETKLRLASLAAIFVSAATQVYIIGYAERSKMTELQKFKLLSATHVVMSMAQLSMVCYNFSDEDIALIAGEIKNTRSILQTTLAVLN